jgi:hypothetical protein
VSWLFDACRLLRKALADAHLRRVRGCVRHTQHDIDIDIERDSAVPAIGQWSSRSADAHQARDVKPRRCARVWIKLGRLVAHHFLHRPRRLELAALSDQMGGRLTQRGNGFFDRFLGAGAAAMAAYPALSANR